MADAQTESSQATALSRLSRSSHEISHLSILRELRELFPSVNPEKLMLLAEKNLRILEGHAALRTRKIGVSIFASFSFLSFASLVYFANLAPPPVEVVYIISLFTLFSLCVTGLFLGASTKAIKQTLQQVKEFTPLPPSKDARND